MGRLAVIVAGALIVALAVWAALPRRTDVAPVATAPAPTTPGALAPAPRAPAAAAPAPAPAAGDDATARIDACIAGQREVAARRQARTAPPPPGESSDAAVVSRACAPLYKEVRCRDAMMHFDEPPPEARSATVFQACARAYCPLLSAPKPAACANTDQVPEDQWVAWSELRQAILTRDLGAAQAQRVLAPAR